MTLITSKHFDDNFLNSEYLRIATQVNDDKGTSLAVGSNYDINRMSSLVRALVVAVNDEYSASLVPVSKAYDRNMLGEMLNRVATVVNDGGGGGGEWLLAGGVWNDSGVWDDSSNWMDEA